MTVKTVSWVSPMGEANERGTRYTTVTFRDDDDTAYIGKKDLDSAMLVHAQLEDAIGTELDFQLEDTGKKRPNGGTRWKILGFGAGSVSSGAETPGGTAPHPGSTPGRSTDVDASIRASVALKAAAEFGASRPGIGWQDVLSSADAFDAWLAKKSSGDRESLDQGVSAEGEAVGTPDTKWQDRVKDWPKDE